MSISIAPRYVVLDLDSTIVWARQADLKKYPTDDKRNFWIKPYGLEFFRVTIRQHFDTFLDHLYARGYKVIVWSAGGDAYVKDIVSVIFKGRYIDYLLTFNHLKDKPGERKLLSHITEFVPDFVPSQARLIDDNPEHFEGQEEYCIHIEPFQFDETIGDDDILLTMADKIDQSFR